jgi:hypothetical protein
LEILLLVAQNGSSEEDPSESEIQDESNHECGDKLVDGVDK